MKRPEVARAILVARVSTKHEEQDASPERQLARLEALARVRGWIVVDRIVERESGARVVSRPAIAGALKKIIDQEADVLVVDHLYRLGRNTRELLEVVDLLAACGGAFVDASNPSLDTTGPLGRMVFTVFASIGQMQREETVQKIHEGLAHARRRGVKLGRRRTVPIAILEKARALRAIRRGSAGEAPSWGEIALLLQAETGKKYGRGALSRGVGRLEEAS